MDNNMVEILSTLLNSSEQKNYKNEISEELQKQYPYGEFPIRYTKLGQEEIRKHSENRFSEEPKLEKEPPSNSSSSSSILSLLPLIQLMTGKKNNKDMMQMLSSIIFKDNPEMKKLFSLLPQKEKTIVKNSSSNFPDTNKVNISSLKRIN